jgi:hypothetical protein
MILRMNDEPKTELADPLTEHTDLKTRWSAIGDKLGKLVMARVDAMLAKTDARDDDDDTAIRKIAALVLASQRSFEMEMRHARHAAEFVSDDDADEERRAAELIAQFDARLEHEVRRLEESRAGRDAQGAGQ